MAFDPAKAPSRRYLAKWQGGYIRAGPGGDPVHVLRKKVRGVAYHVSTGCTALKDALHEFDRFKADPAAYRSPAARAPDPIVLKATLTEQFLDWSLNTERNSMEWVAEQRRYMAWWTGTLGGIDLRGADLRPFYPLARAGGWSTVQKRIAVIKTFYAWLRIVRQDVTPEQDPTFGRLQVPTSQPAQHSRSRVIDRSKVLEIRRAMPGKYKDAVTVLLATAWHGRELVRFAQGGAVEAHPTDPKLRVLMTPKHKSGAVFSTAVSPEAAEAAGRLRATGELSLKNLATALKKACVACKQDPPLSYGSLRHTVTTHAVNAGQDLAVVSSAVGHKDKRTTAKFYASNSVPAKLKTLV